MIRYTYEVPGPPYLPDYTTWLIHDSMSLATERGTRPTDPAEGAAMFTRGTQPPAPDPTNQN